MVALHQDVIQRRLAAVFAHLQLALGAATSYLSAVSGCGHPPPCPRGRVPSPFGPFRGWAFPYMNESALNGSGGAGGARSSEWLYPNRTCNFMPTGAPLWYDPAANRTAVLHWQYCWDSPYVSHANGSVLNATEVSEYFEAQAMATDGDAWDIGAGLDECLSGDEAVKGEQQAAAAGFRAARRKRPQAFIGAWGGQPGETVFRSLMQDWTFTVALIEGYSYCPGDKWCFKMPSQYYPFLDYARAGGYLNRTLFCFGYIIGRSALNPNAWTSGSLRAEMVALKARYPELAGVLMYGRPPNTGFANATNGSTPATENATLGLIRAANQLMFELWPGDPFRGVGGEGGGHAGPYVHSVKTDDVAQQSLGELPLNVLASGVAWSWGGVLFNGLDVLRVRWQVGFHDKCDANLDSSSAIVSLLVCTGAPACPNSSMRPTPTSPLIRSTPTGHPTRGRQPPRERPELRPCDRGGGRRG
jgi:hypothetical protein